MFLNEYRLYSVVHWKSQLLWMWFGAFSLLSQGIALSYSLLFSKAELHGELHWELWKLWKKRTAGLCDLCVWFSCAVTLTTSLVCGMWGGMCNLPLALVPAWLAE